MGNFFTFKGKPINRVIASALFAAIITFGYAIVVYRRSFDVKKVMLFTIICFLFESLLCYLAICFFAHSSRINKRRLEDEDEDEDNEDSDE